MQDNQTADAGQDSLYSVPEAAAALGITVEAVRKRLQRGQLIGFKNAGSWFVQLDQTTPKASRPVWTAPQDRTTTRRPKWTGQDQRPSAQLIEQLKNENTFLKAELERKDALLAAFAQRLPLLVRPPETVAPEPATPTRPRRHWWQLFHFGY